MADKRETVLIEDAVLFGGQFRNFSGRPTKFSPNGGVRSFVTAIPNEEMAQSMAQEGWNIKWTKPREDDDEPTPYISVEVGFKYPPRIVLITSRNRTIISEDMVEILDTVDIEKADLIINPRYWTNDAGETAIKAYLKSLYITVNEDFLERKYAINEQDGL